MPRFIDIWQMCRSTTINHWASKLVVCYCQQMSDSVIEVQILLIYNLSSHLWYTVFLCVFVLQEWLTTEGSLSPSLQKSWTQWLSSSNREAEFPSQNWLTPVTLSSTWCLRPAATPDGHLDACWKIIWTHICYWLVTVQYFSNIRSN